MNMLGCVLGTLEKNLHLADVGWSLPPVCWVKLADGAVRFSTSLLICSLVVLTITEGK